MHAADCRFCAVCLSLFGGAGLRAELPALAPPMSRAEAWSLLREAANRAGMPATARALRAARHPRSRRRVEIELQPVLEHGRIGALSGKASESLELHFYGAPRWLSRVILEFTGGTRCARIQRRSRRLAAVPGHGDADRRRAGVRRRRAVRYRSAVRPLRPGRTGERGGLRRRFSSSMIRTMMRLPPTTSSTSGSTTIHRGPVT